MRVHARHRRPGRHRRHHPGRLIVTAARFPGEKEPRGSFFYARGFSIPELISVILIVAVLSVVAMARFHDGFAQTRGFYDELLAQVQYARKAAVAQRRSVFVRIGATDSLLCYNAAGACNGVVGPNGAVPFRVAVPAGVTVTPAAFEFDGLGRYPAAGPLTVAVAGAGTLQFTVEHETGYVRP